MCAAAWFLSPKGENQVYVPHTHPPLQISHGLVVLRNQLLTPLSRLWRSSLILAIVSCYLMWAITFLAQLHPLVAPKRHDLRSEFVE